MPIYEYRCEPCDHAFETLLRSANDLASCPKCGSLELARLFSVPAAARSAGSASGSSLPICDAGPSVPSFGGCGGPVCKAGLCGLN